jgi:hypothetical protein
LHPVRCLQVSSARFDALAVTRLLLVRTCRLAEIDSQQINVSWAAYPTIRLVFGKTPPLQFGLSAPWQLGA